MSSLGVVLCFIVCLATSNAASFSVFGDPAVVAGWTGGLAGPDYKGQTWIRPITDNGYVKSQMGDPCKLDSSSAAANYVAMTVTFDTTAVRKIFGYSDTISGQDFFETYVYDGPFDSTNACSNLVTKLQGVDGTINDHVLFTAGTKYTIVASSINDATRFSINILESKAHGSTQNSAQLKIFDIDSTGKCSPSEATSPYFAYEWTQATTGYFDLTAGYALNQTDLSWFSTRTFLALFNGSVASQVAAGNTCGPNLISIALSDSYTERDAAITYAHLTAGASYTLVSFTQDENTYGNYGAYITPTARHPFTGQGFKQPIYHNYLYTDDPDHPTGCDPDPNLSSSGYLSFKFTALYDNVQIGARLGADRRNVDQSVVLYLYEGDNTVNPPSTCGTKLLRRHAMYLDDAPFWFNTKPGSTYTIVVAGMDGEPFGSSFYIPSYVLTGTQVGSAALCYEGYYIGYTPSSSTASALSFCFATIVALVVAVSL